jgi:hypothetical protein
VLVVAGAGWLLSDQGVISSDVATSAFRLWPIFLVILGIDVLFKGDTRGWTTWLGPALVIGLVAAYWAFLAGPGEPVLSEAPPAPESGPIDPAGGALNLKIDVGAADLDLKAEPRATVSLAFEGEAPAFGQKGNAVTISGRRHGIGLGCGNSGKTRYDVRIPDRVPVALEIDAGAAKVAADLTPGKVHSVRVSAGAADVSLSLPPPAGEVPVEVDAGASDVTIDVPAGSALRLSSNTAVGNTDTRGLDLDGTGTTAGFDAAKDRFVVKVDGAATDVTIRKR